MKYKKLILLSFLLIFVHITYAQVLTKVKWNKEISSNTWQPGDTLTVTMEGIIDKNWYVYASDFDEDCGPVVATLTIESANSSSLIEMVGKLKSEHSKRKFDDLFECEVSYMIPKAVFQQSFLIKAPLSSFQINLNYQACSTLDGKCILYDELFEFVNQSKEQGSSTPKTSNLINSNNSKTVQSEKHPTKKMEPFFEFSSGDNQISYLAFLIAAFLSGLIALLTPCVFPMIPMTVSFFTSKEKKSLAYAYGFFIVLIYTLIGALLAPLMGADTFNHYATEWLPNLIFFFIFLFFALSFFGMFEIVLPSNWVNFADKNSEKGGLLGVFFMAFTLVLVSFSCTGPIVGTLLVQSAGGASLKPILGMASFGLAFALPFTTFALFPRLLNHLPKSGGWLNNVKVVLGFIELALAFKFISIADQAFHWGILDREVNIAIWVVLFSLLGLYFLGKIRLPHDSPVEHISVPKLILAIISFTFVVYLLPGMWGHPLKALSGYLPPMHSHDFQVTSENSQPLQTQNLANNQINNVDCPKPSYTHLFHFPHQLTGYFDLDEAMACAKTQKKPIFIDFTGHGCVNCREMEAVVWSDPTVQKLLREEFVLLALYVDDKTEISEDKWYVSAIDNKLKKTIGKQNADLQIQRANNNAQPNYFILNHQEKAVLPPKSYDSSIENFITFLKEGIKKFKKNEI